MDQSMMVEPPSHMEQDATIRMNPQVSPESTSGTQVPKVDGNQNGNQNGGTYRGLQQHYQQQAQQRRAQTPETQKRRSNRSEIASPGHLAPFNWEDFVERYEKALQEADENERQMLEDFEQLVKVRIPVLGKVSCKC